MAEKLIPPTRKINKADGIKNPSANSTLTTPSQEPITNARIVGPGAGGSDSIFGAK